MYQFHYKGNVLAETLKFAHGALVFAEDYLNTVT
jgi:hypothetical protein